MIAQHQLAWRYDAAAPSWDATLDRLGFDRVYDALFADIAGSGLLSNVTDSANVLDIGIGTGALTAALLAHSPGTPHVTGIDIAHAMLCAASLRLERLGAPHTLMHADLDALRGYPRQFEAVVCAHVIEHLPNPAAAVRHVYDLVAPGGCFVLVITRRGLWGHYLRHKWGVILPSSDEVRNWFCMAGFGDVNAVPLRGNGWADAASVAVGGRRTD